MSPEKRAYMRSMSRYLECSIVPLSTVPDFDGISLPCYQLPVTQKPSEIACHPNFQPWLIAYLSIWVTRRPLQPAPPADTRAEIRSDNQMHDARRYRS